MYTQKGTSPLPSSSSSAGWYVFNLGFCLKLSEMETHYRITAMRNPVGHSIALVGVGVVLCYLSVNRGIIL